MTCINRNKGEDSLKLFKWNLYNFSFYIYNNFTHTNIKAFARLIREFHYFVIHLHIHCKYWQGQKISHDDTLCGTNKVREDTCFKMCSSCVLVTKTSSHINENRTTKLLPKVSFGFPQNRFDMRCNRCNEQTTGLFVSPSGISELDCETTKTDTAERSISIGRESLQVFFCTRGLGVLPGSTARG